MTDSPIAATRASMWCDTLCWCIGAILILGAGCSDDAPRTGREEGRAKAGSAEAEGGSQPDGEPEGESRRELPPASERLLGRWSLKLDSLPDFALPPELAEARKQGHTEDLRLDYVFTETELILEQEWKGSFRRMSYHYEIDREDGNELEVTRHDEDGEAEKLSLKVGLNKLVVGKGYDRVFLYRKKSKKR